VSQAEGVLEDPSLTGGERYRRIEWSGALHLRTMSRGTLISVLLLLLLAAPATAAPPERWESRAPAPLPRQEAAFTELDGKMYLAGGFEHGGIETARHDVYDVATDTWSMAAPMPEPMHHAVGVGLGGKVYYVGGLQTLGFRPTGRLWAYEPATGKWSSKAGLPAGRERGAGAVAVHDGRIIYAGGQRIVADPLPRRVAVAEVDMYDPATDSWSRLPDMPTPRDHLGLEVVGDTAYAVGGRKLRFDLPVTATEALNLKTRQWRTDLAPIPTSRGGFATGVVGGRIVAIGGESPHPDAPTPLHVHAHDDVESYDPRANAWRPMAPMPFGRYGIQGAVHDRGIWVAGGGIGLSVDATDALSVFFPGRGRRVADQRGRPSAKRGASYVRRAR
jgi:N-acetylneuraminic acid mutarotase